MYTHYPQVRSPVREYGARLLSGSPAQQLLPTSEPGSAGWTRSRSDRLSLDVEHWTLNTLRSKCEETNKGGRAVLPHPGVLTLTLSLLLNCKSDSWILNCWRHLSVRRLWSLAARTIRNWLVREERLMFVDQCLCQIPRPKSESDRPRDLEGRERCRDPGPWAGAGGPGQADLRGVEWFRDNVQTLNLIKLKNVFLISPFTRSGHWREADEVLTESMVTITMTTTGLTTLTTLRKATFTHRMDLVLMGWGHPHVEVLGQATFAAGVNDNWKL